jgi:hypothetical protein
MHCGQGRGTCKAVERGTLLVLNEIAVNHAAITINSVPPNIVLIGIILAKGLCFRRSEKDEATLTI